MIFLNHVHPKRQFSLSSLPQLEYDEIGSAVELKRKSVKMEICFQINTSMTPSPGSILVSVGSLG
jgi:hypothetical protein